MFEVLTSEAELIESLNGAQDSQLFKETQLIVSAKP